LINYFTVTPAAGIRLTDANVAVKLLTLIKMLHFKTSRVSNAMFNGHNWWFIVLERQLFTTINAFLALLYDIYSARMIFVTIKRNVLS